MKELCPNRKSDIITFSAAVQECLDKDDTHIGLANISASEKSVCIAKGSSVEVVRLQNGKRVAAYSFNENKKTQLQITCFCPYQNKYLITLAPQDLKQENSFLCIYDPGTSRVIKVIELPTRPTSLCLLKEYGGAGDISNFIR